jgi:predicted transposase YdaD
MGLVYPESLAKALLQGVRRMKESVTYQAILREGKVEGKAEGKAEGKVEEAQRILLRQGRKRFGQAKAGIRAKIETITDLDQLERLAERILEATSWNDLIAES